MARARRGARRAPGPALAAALAAAAGVAGVVVGRVDGAAPFDVVDLASAPLGSSGALPLRLAALACAGLANRPGSTRRAYTLGRPEDAFWLEQLGLNATGGASSPVGAAPYVASCARACGRYVRYAWPAQQALLPLVVSLAAALDAVPLAAPLAPPAGVVCAYDAAARLGGLSAAEATRRVFELVGNATTGLAKLDPGYDTSHPVLHPHRLVRVPNVDLADYVVKVRLFALFLPDGCAPLTAEHAVLEGIVARRPAAWGEPPLAVYGYDDSFAVAGDLFEAETDCTHSHSLGQVASAGVTNLAFLSSTAGGVARAAGPAPGAGSAAPPPAPPAYDPNATYVAFIVGDGDNVEMVTSSRARWMTARHARCAPPAPPCAPLAWTLSPHLSYLAPAVLGWFRAQAAPLADDFVLPPSGHLYAYPSQLNEADRRRFVARTEADARVLDTSGTVAWEFAGTWENAIEHYFPLYAAAGVVHGAFAVNVPFDLPVAAFGRGEDFKVLGAGAGGGGLVLFRPREWRGNSSSAVPFSGPESLSPQELAANLGSLERGYVAAVYVTSDGGADLDGIEAVLAALPEHVRVVGHDTLVTVALEKAAGRQAAAREPAARIAAPRAAGRTRPIAHDSS